MAFTTRRRTKLFTVVLPDPDDSREATPENEAEPERATVRSLAPRWETPVSSKSLPMSFTLTKAS